MRNLKFCDYYAFFNKNLKKNKIFKKSSFILDSHLGKVFYIYTGNKFFSIYISSRMKGHRFGEFCLTRKQFSHKRKKK